MSVCVCVIAVLSFWYHITSPRALPWRSLFLPLSAVLSCLRFFTSGWGLLSFTPHQHVLTSALISSCLGSHVNRRHKCSFCHPSETQPSSKLRAPMALTIFPPLFWRDPRGLVAGVGCGCVNGDWAGCVFCNSLHRLQREVSLMSWGLLLDLTIWS